MGVSPQNMSFGFLNWNLSNMDIYMEDILDRLKATTKINGAYPRDIQDAINEIEWNRSKIASLLADIAEYAEAYSELSLSTKKAL